MACYTIEHQIVWRETIKQKQIFLKEYENYIYQPYLDGFSQLNFDDQQIPAVSTLTDALKSTGWQPVFVEGYLPIPEANHFYVLSASSNPPLIIEASSSQ